MPTQGPRRFHQHPTPGCTCDHGFTCRACLAATAARDGLRTPTTVRCRGCGAPENPDAPWEADGLCDGCAEDEHGWDGYADPAGGDDGYVDEYE